MGRMGDLQDPQLCEQVIIPADPVAVRAGLRALFDTLLLRSLPEDGRGTAEIVLAEALNNIVEHAYSRHDGEIEITLRLRGPDLVCSIRDNGLPMPNGLLPAGRLVALSSTDDLPEGGFGWFLIRSLSQDLDYQRVEGRNCLSFRLCTNQSAP